MVTRIGPKTPRVNYLAARREKAGLTQEQLAERVGTYKGQISNWENQKRNITSSAQIALADALGLEDPGDLYHDPERPTPADLLRDASVREMTLILNEQDAKLKEQALEMVKVLVGRRAS